ncbi:MAG: DUF2169 domain-containing protein [Polyangiaceae bacterium]
MRRVLVGIAPIRVDGERKPVKLPFLVGVLFWHGEGEDMISVIVKATTSLHATSDDGPKFLEPRGWVISQTAPPERRIVGSTAVPRPFDFVPSKDRCDVMLSGHVDVGASAMTASGLPFRAPDGSRPPIHQAFVLRAPGAAANFTVTTTTPGRTPLVPPYVSIGGEGIAEIGPRSPRVDPVAEGFLFPRGFDYGAFSLANPRLCSDEIGPGAEITLEGLGPEALVVRLPKRFPRGLIDWTRTPFPSDAGMLLDTVHIDLDAEIVDLTWRGFTIAGPNPRSAVDRVIVGFLADHEIVTSKDPRERYHKLFAELPRGSFEYAWEISDVQDGKKPPPIPEEEYEMARYEALGSIEAPEPTLDLREHAMVAAELLEIRMTPGLTTAAMDERMARAEVLEKYDLDEFSWSIEERAHANRLATVPMDTEENLHVEYARHFLTAQERLAPPGETLPSPKEYASISSRLQVEQPRDVLHDAKLSLGAWMRIDRKYQEKMATDEALRDEVDRLLEAEEGERGEPKLPDVDDDGVIR